MAGPQAVEAPTAASTAAGQGSLGLGPGLVTPLAQVRLRQRVRVHGRVRSLRVLPMAAAPSIECVLVDDTGALSAVFFGRRTIPGLDVGSRVQVEGMAGESKGRLAILNPTYKLLLPNTRATGPDRS